MTIQNNISLKPYNTFGIDVNAKQFISVNSIQQLKEVLKQHPTSKKLFLGGGSNMLLTKNVDGLVIHLNLKGKDVILKAEHHVLVESSAGENWHEFVLWTLDNGFGGIENMSLIPGNVGASPIQNIGAYGVELKDVFISCKALNIKTLEIETFKNEDCQFDYRNSIFKNKAKHKYIILSVTFQLSTNHHILKVDYGAIKEELASKNILNPSIKEVSNAVISIRQSKLPDPKKIGNSGSFFKNPIISTDAFYQLLENFPDIPNYKISETEVKIPAGWLIEKTGFKGKTFKTYGVHKNQALVLVNYGEATGLEILNLSLLIQETVKRIFNISIETEVNIL